MIEVEKILYDRGVELAYEAEAADARIIALEGLYKMLCEGPGVKYAEYRGLAPSELTVRNRVREEMEAAISTKTSLEEKAGEYLGPNARGEHLPNPYAGIEPIDDGGLLGPRLKSKSFS